MGLIFEDVKEALEREKKKNACKGLFWRAKVSSYCYDGKLGMRKTLNFLKRASCTGCEHCGWVLEFLEESVPEDPNVDYFGNLEHNKIYTYSPVTSKDWESGHVDLEYIEFVEVNGKEN